MGFKDFVKFLFTGKSDEINQEQLKETTEEIPETIQEEEQVSIKENEEISEPKKITTYNKQEVDSILNSITIDKESLSLKKLESEAETLNSYLKGLVKDIANYEGNLDDKDKKSAAANGISAKMKHIILRGLELKNMVAMVEDQYYEELISQLKKLHEKVQKEKIKEIIGELEKDHESLRELENELGKLVVYDYKLNSERNVDYLNAIDEAVKNKTLSEDVNSLISKLLAITDKTAGLRNKIERNNIIEKVRNLI